MQLACLTLLVHAGAGWAKPRTAVLPFTGSKTKKRPDIERQLSASLCDAVTCVGAAQVTTRGEVDWAKVSAAQLTGVVIGKISRDPKTRRNIADIQILASAKVVLVRRKVTLQDTGLPAASLVALRNDLAAVLQRARGPETPVVPPGATPAAPPAAADGARPAEVASGAGAAAAGEGAAAAADEDESGPPLLEVEVTLGLLHRAYTVSGQGAQTFYRDSSVGLPEPGLFVAVSPLRSADGLFASLGLEAGVATSVGIAIQRENDASGTVFPATLFLANVGLRLKLRFGPTVIFRPLVGWQMMNFDVHPSLDGTVLTGQPAVHWRAIRAGAAVDVTLASWCTLFAEASYLYVYGAGPIAAGPNFPSASGAPSFSGALGLSFRVAPRLELRLGFLFSRYALNLNDTTSPPRATGITDQLLGATLGARYSF